MGRSAAAWLPVSRLPREPFTHPAVEMLVADPIVRFVPPSNDVTSETLRPLQRHATEFVLVFDTETTGREGNARLVEIYIALVRVATGEATETFGSLINPGMRIPPMATAVHHITDAMVSRSPFAAEVLPKALAFAVEHGSVMVAHNAPFDLARIKYEAQRTDTSLPGTVKVHCSLAASRKLRTAKSHALQAMAADYGIRVDSAHRARGDVDTLRQAIPRLLKEPKAGGRDLRECFPLSGVL